MAVCPDVQYNTLAEPSGMGGIIRFLDINYCAHPTSICESLLFIQPSGGGAGPLLCHTKAIEVVVEVYAET